MRMTSLTISEWLDWLRPTSFGCQSSSVWIYLKAVAWLALQLLYITVLFTLLQASSSGKTSSKICINSYLGTYQKHPHASNSSTPLTTASSKSSSSASPNFSVPGSPPDYAAPSAFPHVSGPYHSESGATGSAAGCTADDRRSAAASARRSWGLSARLRPHHGGRGRPVGRAQSCPGTRGKSRRGAWRPGAPRSVRSRTTCDSVARPRRVCGRSRGRCRRGRCTWWKKEGAVGLTLG